METASEHKPSLPGSGALRVAHPQGASLGRLMRRSGSGIVLALVLLLIAGWRLSEHFMTVNNTLNVSRQIAIMGLLGIGMTFVILTGGIDLSVGSIFGFTAIVAATLLSRGVPGAVAIPVVLVVGAAVGAINGLGVTKGKLPPFIMTLGMLVIARGVTMTYTEGEPVVLKKTAAAFAWLDAGSLLGIPTPVWVLVIFAAAAGFLLRYTPFGRSVYAVGDNLEAARLSGIKTGRVIFSVYVISGLCAAMSALIIVSRVGSASPASAGDKAELDAIAIVVIGGTSLFGGEGGIWGTLVGAAIVGVVANLMNLTGVTSFSQPIVMGLIILGAVLLERHGRGRRRGG